MTKRMLFHNIMERKSETCGFWHGDPHPESNPALHKYFNVDSDLSLGLALGDCFQWVMPEKNGMWAHPDGLPMFDTLGGKDRESLNQDGVFAECEDVREVEQFQWPDTKYCDFSGTETAVKDVIAKGQAVLSGTWSCFFHVVCDFFGMENYFVKMHTDPKIVQAVTEQVVDFYLEANEKWYDIIGDNMDAIFFGNDFGSQLDLLVSPEMFDKFIMPYFAKITNAAKRRGYKVVLHSCGSIERVIPRLIDAGVDALHPIQAKARNMDATHLAKEFGKDIIFVGGVDTQDLLPFGTTAQVKDEVLRLKEIMGPNFIVSPSHEALLPNVPPENVEAMARAV